jgi:hypothetical protein
VVAACECKVGGMRNGRLKIFSGRRGLKTGVAVFAGKRRGSRDAAAALAVLSRPWVARGRQYGSFSTAKGVVDVWEEVGSKGPG